MLKRFFARVSEALSDLRDFARREPAIVRYLIGVAVVVAARYGLDLDPEVVWTFVVGGAGVTVATRRKVVPEADLHDHRGEPGHGVHDV